MAHRRVAARVLVVLASLLAFTAILAVWANRQLLNTDNWTETSTRLLEEPVIRAQVGGFLVDQLYANVDIEGELRRAVPPRLQPLAGPAASQLRALGERATVAALGRPRIQQLWADANRNAQLALLKVLEGGGPNVSTEGGVVVLHLRSLLTQIAQRVGVGGRLADAIPAGAADVTVLRSNQLAAAQTALRVLRGLPYVLVGLSLIGFAVALAVAPDWRRQALRAYGVGFVVAGAAALATQSLAGDALTNALASTAALRPAIRSGWTISTSLLEQAAVATIGYGVAMVLGAWLSGPTRPAVALRRMIAPYVREPAIAYASLAVLVALLLWWHPTPATHNPALALILIALLAAGTAAFRRQIGREHPDAARTGDELARIRDYLGQAVGRVRDGAAAGRAVVVEHGPHRDAGSAAHERIDQLERLGRLRDAGVLDADEFAAQKQRVLAGDEPPVPNGVRVTPALTPEA